MRTRKVIEGRIKFIVVQRGNKKINNFLIEISDQVDDNFRSLVKFAYYFDERFEIQMLSRLLNWVSDLAQKVWSVHVHCLPEMFEF